MRIEICLLLWGGLRAPGGAIAQRISRRADCPARSRYDPYEAAISGNTRRVCSRSARHPRGYADAREGARLPPRHTGWRNLRRFFAELAGFSCSRTHVSAADPGGWTRWARRIAGSRADSNLLPRALRDSRCRPPGLPLVLRKGIAVPANDELSAFHLAGQCDRARHKSGESDPVVAKALGIFLCLRRKRHARAGPRLRPSGSPQKGASLPVLAEIAEKITDHQGSERRIDVL